MIRHLILLIVLMHVSTVIHAESTEVNSALDDLIQLMNTKIGNGTTEQRSDLAPGVITILDKSTMLDAGVRTVSEALSLVAGFDNPEAQISDDEPVFRGVGGIFTGTSGKIRMMVNGIVTNNAISANSSLVLQMPVEQVERIEIISGPGSAIYGEYALLGVINVVTDKDKSYFYARAGSFGQRAIGGSTSVRHRNNLTSHFDLSVWHEDGADVESGTDILTAFGQPELSLAPGEPNLRRRFMSAFYSLEAQNWSLEAFHLVDERGDGYGIGGALSGSDDLVQESSQTGFQWRYQQAGDRWDVDYQLAMKYFDIEFDSLFLYPAGLFGIYPIDIESSSNVVEERIEAGISAKRRYSNHDLTLGLQTSESKAKNIRFASNIDESTLVPVLNVPAPLTELTPQPLGLEGKSRTIVSAYLSDQITISDQLEIVAGLRLDEYDDFSGDDLISPRLSATYQMNSHHVFKSQYARAFRPPSFSELFYQIGLGVDGTVGNEDLEAEINDTLEFVHDYQTRRTRIRSTLFLSEIEGLIRYNNRGRYENVLDARSSGLEISAEHYPDPTIKLSGNVTFLDAINDDSNEKLEGSTDKLMNIGMTWKPRGKYSTTLRYQYVGQRFRSETDVRSSLESYGIFSFNGLIRDFLAPGVSLRYGINNLLDKDFRNPAPASTYEDDYPGAGREYWLQISQSFG